MKIKVTIYCDKEIIIDVPENISEKEIDGYIDNLLDNYVETDYEIL